MSVREKQPVYKVLFLEDNQFDIELMQRQLSLANLSFVSENVDTKEDFLSSIEIFNPDIVLADYTLPSFNGMEAFKLMKQNRINIPFILVTGSLSEQIALECLAEGVNDFILKSSFGRLPSAITNALEKNKIEKEKEKISAQLKKTQIELRMLLGSLQTSREEERKRIAREIHDELGQELTALRIDASMLKKKILTKTEVHSHFITTEFDSIIQLIDSSIRSVKRIATQLRPEILDHFGVIESVKHHAREFESKTGIQCIVKDLQSHLELNPQLATAAYRVVQEVLTNIARHSEATVANILIGREAKTFLIEIKDNGKGIRPEEAEGIKSLGLIGMRERVFQLDGKIKIEGTPGIGTVVSVKIPM